MSLLDKLLEVVFPTRCPICGEVNLSNEPCENCSKELLDCRFTGKTCKRCGNEKLLCECSKYNYLFSGVSAPFKNIGIAKDGVYGLKFRNRPYAAKYFGKEIAESFKAVFCDIKPDVICIVPTFKGTVLKRDYDYIALLAKKVAEILEIPLEVRLIKKIKKNGRQHTLSHDKRQANVKGVFEVKKDLSGKTVLLIDDIKTTGYTLNECAKQLRLAGAERVYAAVALLTANNTCKKRKS